jgi:hypothetical protein
MQNCSTNQMAGKRWWMVLIICALLSSTAIAQTTAKAMQASVGFEGFAIGFADTLKAAGKPFWYEASAVLYDGKSVLVAHDKPMPNGQSSVGLWPSPEALFNQLAPTYFTNPLFRKGIKYEELTQTPDRKWVFLTTAFDRVKEGSKDWDGYNMLLYWPAEKPEQARVLSVPPSDTVSTSVLLRDKIASAIAQSDVDYFGHVRYYKLEGLTATATKLYFGVREEGNSFQDFKPVVKVLSIPYQVVKRGDTQRIELTGSFALVGTVDVTRQTTDRLPDRLALSSIEYDPIRQFFWIITTYENGEKVGACLWTATEADLAAGKMELVRSSSGAPFLLTHKAEDMTFTSPNSILVLHDDDRLPTRVGDIVRKPNQSAYTVLEVR